MQENACRHLGPELVSAAICATFRNRVEREDVVKPLPPESAPTQMHDMFGPPKGMLMILSPNDMTEAD